MIGGWIRSILREVGIEGNPGSIRAAVASSSWLQIHPVDEILSRGNWRAENTFKRHYCRTENSDKSTNGVNLWGNFKTL